MRIRPSAANSIAEKATRDAQWIMHCRRMASGSRRAAQWLEAAQMYEQQVARAADLLIRSTIPHNA